MALLKPERFIILKQKIKQECQRRKYNINGKSISVAPYGETAYDYTNIPQTNNIIKEEHWDKLIVPMNQINSNNNYKLAQEDKIPVEEKMFDIETKIDTYSQIAVTDRSRTSCNGNCTGLCYTTCTTGCYGCSSCSGCSGCTSCTSCSGGCDGCSGCSGGCTGGCQGCGSCGSTPCATSCSGGCKGGCKGCANSCTGTKTGTCVACSGSSTHSS